MACSCSNATIPCSEFCGCQDSCQNRWNLRDIDIYDCNESDDDSEIETMIFMTTLCRFYHYIYIYIYIYLYIYIYI